MARRPRRASVGAGRLLLDTFAVLSIGCSATQTFEGTDATRISNCFVDCSGSRIARLETDQNPWRAVPTRRPARPAVSPKGPCGLA